MRALVIALALVGVQDAGDSVHELRNLRQLKGAPERIKLPVEKEGFLVPAPGKESEPYWGIKDGIAVGLWPTDGPRGLIRIYAPYLGQKRLVMINYIAVEPRVEGNLGQSELEQSAHDGLRGKAMWTTNEIDNEETKPRRPWEPASGKIVTIEGAKALTIYVHVERYNNGALPIVQVILRADRPHEVTFKTFAAKESAKLESLHLAATMGNYARLRHLWLRGEVAVSTKVWSDHKVNSMGFLPQREWTGDRLLIRKGETIVAMTANESDPAAATYDKDVNAHWHYEGKPATQYWRVKERKGLATRVDGRLEYWSSHATIPGGVAFETWWMQTPYAEGEVFQFGVTPDPPEKLGFDPEWLNHLTGGR